MKQIDVELTVTYTMSVTAWVDDETYGELKDLKELYHGKVDPFSRRFSNAVDFLANVDDEDACDVGYTIKNIEVIDG